MAKQPTRMIYGGPQKRFFVSMLTRDIDLDDAILDLIDNSVDGAMRESKRRTGKWKAFKGYWTKLTINREKFEIVDNCGGIPAEFLEAAFSLGRPNITKDGDIPTIGMYGIGMKRAIFKMAQTSTVISRSGDAQVSVQYNSSWLDPENNSWELPLEDLEKSKDHGVSVTVPSLRANVSTLFGNGAFVNALKLKISDHFGYIIQRGFKIYINEEELPGHVLRLLDTPRSDGPAIRAYDYHHVIDGVSINVTVGFFRRLVRDAEIDEEAISATEGAGRAGISVVCNDRVVLLSDKSLRTGWGDGGLPKFHPQFRAIAGVIDIFSNDASKLPIATTKNDLDVGSDIYLAARRACIEGVKVFTGFTNRWKGMEDKTAEFFDAAELVEARRGIDLATKLGRKLRNSDAVRFQPRLPEPVVRNPMRRISFLRELRDIKAVSKVLFKEDNQTPAVVGEECFDRFLAKVPRR